MAWPMSHLYVAKNILYSFPIELKDISQYYLGTLAPDAVYFRQNYQRDLKRISHLYTNIDKSDIDYYSEKWKKNVIEFFVKNNSQGYFDFLLGYCIHLLLDIFVYKNIYRPYISENNSIDKNGCTKTYTNENLAVDLEIYQELNYEETIFPILASSKPTDFIDILETDMERIKNNILNVQYKNKTIIDTANNKFYNFDKIIGFNNQSIEYIKKEFIEAYVKK